MSNEPNKSEAPPKLSATSTSKKEKWICDIRWLYLAIAPIPVGLLLSIHNLILRQNVVIAYLAFTLFCSLLGGISIFGGFKGRSWKIIVCGILVGLFFSQFDAMVVGFVGCCTSFGKPT